MKERLEVSTLYLAATRPALFLGVPLALAGAFLMLIGLIMVFLKNPLYEVCIIPLWMAARLLVARDYNAANVVTLWLRTAGRGVDSYTWGGSSVSPNPIKPDRRPRGTL
jgi:type IV secretion system protein VirB3